MRIYYCDICNTRLSEDDIESGKAVFGSDEHAYCKNCVPVEFQNASPTSESATTPGRRSDTSANIHRRTPIRTPNGGAGRSKADLPSVSAPHTSSIKTTAAPKKPFPTQWAILCGAVSLAALVTAMYALGVFSSAPKQAAKILPATAPENSTSVPDVTKLVKGKPLEDVSIPAQTVQPAPAPRNMFEEMAREHQREFDPEQLKAVAARRLKDANEFFAQNPQDLWTYAEMLGRVSSGTPAADEAARLKKAINFPADSTQTPGWYREWNFTTPGERKSLLYDFAGRKNVLQTNPPGANSETVFTRRVTVPIDKPYYSVAMRCDDNGACLFAIEIEGKQHVMETLRGTPWRTINLDLSELKGKDVSVQMRQVTTSANPNMYWAPPSFQATPDMGVKPIAFNATAPAYTRPKPPPPAPTRVFRASATWKESAGWKQPIDLLAKFDLKADAVSGTWTRSDKGDLQSGSSKSARIALPYAVPEQYDVRVSFERKTGIDTAVLILSRSGKQFAWLIGAASNKTMAIALVGGKTFDGNPAVSSCNSCLKNGERRTTLVEVRRDRVSAYLDGKLVQEWVPSMGELGMIPSWKVPDGRTLGLGSWQSDVIFYSMQIVEVK